MDTSETYIKQCKKAKKIQKRVLKEGDYFYDHPFGVQLCWYLGDWRSASIPYSVNPIWLPRQDQLQEMVSNCKDHNGTLGKGMYLLQKMVDWNISPDGWKSKVDASSMEQLWLAFVMKEKFNKTWNGEDWG